MGQIRRVFIWSGTLLLLFVIALGLVGIWRDGARPRPPQHLPRWGDVALTGAFTLFERGEDGRESLEILYAQRRRDKSVPAALVAGRNPEIRIFEADKKVLGQLFGELRKLPGFMEQELRAAPVAGSLIEVGIVGGGRLHRRFAVPPDDNLSAAKALFRSALAAARQDPPVSAPAPK